MQGNTSDSAVVPSRKCALFSLAALWHAVFCVAYAAEFCCLSLAELMVLDRMWVFAVHGKSRLWIVAGWFVMLVVFICNIVGLASNVAASVYFKDASSCLAEASRLFEIRMTIEGDAMFASCAEINAKAFTMASIQSFCEVVTLLIIVIAFVVVGIACAHRVSSALLVLPLLARTQGEVTAAAGKKLRLRIVGTTVFVFAVFLLRSGYSTLHALAHTLQDSGKTCPAVSSGRLFCSSCYNTFTHIGAWMNRTPEFQVTVVLVSSPVAMLVALWGMRTTKRTQRSKTFLASRSALESQSST
jgi:hypothetical protein